MVRTIQHKPTTPGVKTRQYKTLSRLISNGKRSNWTASVNGVSRLQFLDDISRLRAKGWTIQSTKARSGQLRYRIVS